MIWYYVIFGESFQIYAQVRKSCDLNDHQDKVKIFDITIVHKNMSANSFCMRVNNFKKRKGIK